MSLLPSKPEAAPPDDAEPRVIGVDSEDAEDVLSALSSETARKLLAEIHDDPAAPSELADRVDTSLQNAQYHLEKLESAGAVAVVDTAYSAKGREMDVYAPADQPLVIFAGDDDDSSLLRSALSRVLGAVGVLGLASLAIQQLYGERGLFGGDPLLGSGGDGAADGGQAGGAVPSETPSPSPADTPAPETTSGGDGPGIMDVGTDTPTETAIETMTETAANATDTVVNATQTAPEAADTAREVAAGLPPGLLFFAGGLFALVVVGAVLTFR